MPPVEKHTLWFPRETSVSLTPLQATNITNLRALLSRTDPCIAMSTHFPLSARLAVEADFPALWVSGFELSALHAVPDASILPMSTHLETMRAIHEAVPSIPLVVDCDTGWGNAVNVVYNTQTFAAAGASAVVLEDKTFPKDSSLRPGGRQVCIPAREFQGKVRAAKQSGGGLLVIARTEALIAGLGQEEALARATAYAEAGADAVLVHSKQDTPDETLSFCSAWKASCSSVPLILVPTSYPQLSFSQIRQLGVVSMIICGNHAIRAAMAGMRRCFQRIRQEESIAGVEEDVSGVDRVFEAMGNSELVGLEQRFL